MSKIPTTPVSGIRHLQLKTHSLASTKELRLYTPAGSRQAASTITTDTVNRYQMALILWKLHLDIPLFSEI